MALHGVTPQQNADTTQERIQRQHEAVLKLYQLNFQMIPAKDGKTIVMLCHNNRPVVSPQQQESVEKALQRHLWMHPRSVYHSGMTLYRQLLAQSQQKNKG